MQLKRKAISAAIAQIRIHSHSKCQIKTVLLSLACNCSVTRQDWSTTQDFGCECNEFCNLSSSRHVTSEIPLLWILKHRYVVRRNGGIWMINDWMASSLGTVNTDFLQTSIAATKLQSWSIPLIHYSHDDACVTF